MRRTRLSFFTGLLLTVAATGIQAQQHQPIKWHVTAVSMSDRVAKLIFTANLEDGWHIYSQFIDEGGPLPTTFTFIPDHSYSLKGKVKEESTPVKQFDAVFLMNIAWYEDTVVFSQEVKLNGPTTTIKGKVEFMGCNNFMCLLPDEEGFSVEVKEAREKKNNKGK